MKKKKNKRKKKSIQETLKITIQDLQEMIGSTGHQ